MFGAFEVGQTVYHWSDFYQLDPMTVVESNDRYTHVVCDSDGVDIAYRTWDVEAGR